MNPPSTESYFTDRSKEDNNFLNLYIQKRSLSMDDEIVRFLHEKITNHLISGRRSSSDGIERAS